jgi:hypothetical protein
MSGTLSQLIDRELGVETREAARQAPSASPSKPSSSDLHEEAEKVASVLDYLVNGGLEKAAGLSDTDHGRPIPRRGTTINTLSTQRGTGHPALANHAAAAAAGKGDVAQDNTPALRMALDNEPYADPMTGQILNTSTNHRDVNARRAAAAKAELKRRKGA